MTRIYQIFYTILQCTWGIPQTIVGFVLYLRYKSKNHSIYYGSILTKWDRSDGISLGLFVFVPNDIGVSKGLQEYYNKMAIHEYGHTIQSLILGPLYLPIVGVISLLWSSLPMFKRIRKEKKLPYSFCFTESWADKLGERFTKL